MGRRRLERKLGSWEGWVAAGGWRESIIRRASVLKLAI